MVPPRAVYSSEATMSRSSWPFSMPVPHIQLKSTALRSLASFAGVYGSVADAPGGLCAPAVNGPAIARAIPSATRVQRLLRASMVVLPLLINGHRRDPDDVPAGQS